MLVALIAASTTDAMEFNCVFEFYDIPLEIGTVYACSPTVFLFGSNTLDKVTGVHQSGYSNYNVEFLTVKEQKMQIIPQGIATFFKNLKAMKFHGSQMLSISAKDLQPFPNLEYLVLYGNSFKSLDADLFFYTPRLRYLHLGANKLRHIGEDLVTNLVRLEYLNLEDNDCIDESAYKRAEIEILAAQLSFECPPLGKATSAGKNDFQELREEVEEALIRVVTTLNDKIEEQKENIDLLLLSNVALIQANEKFVQQITALEKALLEVKEQQQEISSKMRDQSCHSWTVEHQAS